jgi:uncharacterized coiled-coil DUF342 family protein
VLGLHCVHHPIPPQECDSPLESLKAEKDALTSALDFVFNDTMVKQNCEIESLKAENESLRQEVAAYREEQTPSLKAEVMYLKAGLKKCHGRMLKAQRKAAKNRSDAHMWNEFTNITLAQTAGFLSEN